MEQELLQYGAMGVMVIGLAGAVLILWTELNNTRKAHAVAMTKREEQIAAKDELILKLQETRIAEARTGFDIARSNQQTLDALLTAIRTTR